MAWPCPKNGRSKITQNSIEVDAETKESMRKTEEKLVGRYKDGHEQKKLNEGQWEDRNQWILGVGQRRTTFWNRHTYIHTYNINGTLTYGLTIFYKVESLITTHRCIFPLCFCGCPICNTILKRAKKKSPSNLHTWFCSRSNKHAYLAFLKSAVKPTSGSFKILPLPARLLPSEVR